MPAYFTIFDVETNGLHPGRFSVLSFSALQIQTWRFQRPQAFQGPPRVRPLLRSQEPYNYHAIKVNGLTQKRSPQKRGRTGGDYPLHFAQDRRCLSFASKWSLPSAHNTPFDTKFLKQAHGYEFPATFCTMRTFTSYCAIPHHHFGIKWPKLEEAVQIICGRNDF
ncbi:MAG: hypothetical protein U5L00_17710 [Desulfovermiculus sp.]|nr:hypothetical protein [Desulfovermiculus sp.]